MSPLLGYMLVCFGVSATPGKPGSARAHNGMVCLLSIMAQFLVGYSMCSGILGTVGSVGCFYSCYLSVIHFYALLYADILHQPFQLDPVGFSRFKKESDQLIYQTVTHNISRLSGFLPQLSHTK